MNNHLSMEDTFFRTVAVTHGRLLREKGHREQRRGRTHRGAGRQGMERADPLQHGANIEGLLHDGGGPDRLPLGHHHPLPQGIGGRFLDGRDRDYQLAIQAVRLLGTRLHHPKTAGDPACAGDDFTRSPRTNTANPSPPPQLVAPILEREEEEAAINSLYTTHPSPVNHAGRPPVGFRYEWFGAAEAAREQYGLGPAGLTPNGEGQAAEMKPCLSRKTAYIAPMDAS